MGNNPQIVCFGEILWDVFPDKTVIGGAPLNVSLRLHNQGHSSVIISKIGNDSNGKKVLEYLRKEQFNVDGIQFDNNLRTGEVLVTLNETGTASYEIIEPVAWDEIEDIEIAKSLVKNASIFLFGSLACRNQKSRNTLFTLLEYSNFSVFDVNLRPPHYSIDLIIQLMSKAQFVKMNDEELLEISDALACPFKDLTEKAKWLKGKVTLDGICVTKGANGAFLLMNDKEFHHQGFKVKVEDTVGAGDSFLATLLGELFLKNASPQRALERACAVGSLVASKVGANCKVTESEINSMLLKPNE